VGAHWKSSTATRSVRGRGPTRGSVRFIRVHRPQLEPPSGVGGSLGIQVSDNATSGRRPPRRSPSATRWTSAATP
jgi:hypothetical protein